MWIALCTAAVVGSCVLAENGKSEYVIVVPSQATAPVRYAAEELRDHLREISGASLTIVTDQERPQQRELLVGPTNRAESKKRASRVESLKPDGYLLARDGDKLVFFGTEPRGTLYAVYGFLEDHLGCRWFTPEVRRVPKLERVAFDELDDVQEPPLEYREPFVYDCFDGDWCARNRVNSSSGRLEAKHGGKVRFGNGYFVHTFAKLVPTDKYFDEHPEYFSLVNGVRQREMNQLCPTNPEVARIATESVLAAIEADPEATVFSVSQNDWDNHCECDVCQALAKEEGAQMAPVLLLVNRVAEAVEAKHPDKLIETLAYQWTRSAPKTMRPRKNVVVRLCSIEACFSHTLEECETNQSFVKDLRDWSKASDRLWVWDYVTSFRHYYVPFPNLHVRAPNIRLFAGNHVTGIFEQDVYQTPNGEFSALSGYLGAKLLWNPEADAEAIIDEFLEAVYGRAAPQIREVIELQKDRVVNDHIHMNIWVGPKDAHLTDELLASCDELFETAERRVANDEATLRRVQIARIPIDYSILERSRGKPFNEGGPFRLENGTPVVNPAYLARLDRFEKRGKMAGILTISEGSYPLESYVDSVRKVLEGAMSPHDGFMKSVVLEKEPSPRYAANGAKSLTDGMRGTADFSDGPWLGFETHDMVATVDMGAPTKLSRVAPNLLVHPPGWIFSPAKVSLSLSKDGRIWDEVAHRSPAETARDEPIHQTSIDFDLEGQEARYVKVKIEHRPHGPQWHMSRNSPVWFFIDEIEVWKAR